MHHGIAEAQCIFGRIPGRPPGVTSRRSSAHAKQHRQAITHRRKERRPRDHAVPVRGTERRGRRVLNLPGGGVRSTTSTTRSIRVENRRGRWRHEQSSATAAQNPRYGPSSRARDPPPPLVWECRVATLSGGRRSADSPREGRTGIRAGRHSAGKGQLGRTAA